MVIVVDNGSTDDTVRIAQELADLVLHGGPERSAQRNIGAAATDAPVLGFIDSDMILSPDVVRDASGAIEPGRCCGRGSRADGRGRVSGRQCGPTSGPSMKGAKPSKRPASTRRSVSSWSGGFDEAMTGGEDWDLALRLEDQGAPVRIEPVILHDEGRVRYLDACRKKAYYADGVALVLRKARVSRPEPVRSASMAATARGARPAPRTRTRRAEDRGSECGARRALTRNRFLGGRSSTDWTTHRTQLRTTRRTHAQDTESSGWAG